MFSRLASMLSICLFFSLITGWCDYKPYAYEKKHVHAVKAIRLSLHASCCVYKLFRLCYKSNCMKGGSHKYVRDVDQMRQNTEKKLPQMTISLWKWTQLKVYSHPVQRVWISSLTPILIFWWTELVILRIHRKVYQNFIFNFGKKICIVSDLKLFLPHWKTCFIPSIGMVETSYCDGFYMLYVPCFVRSWVIVQTG